MAEPMSRELLDLIEAHLNLERQSAADYFAAAIWFAERELTGFAEHLRDEAKQEEQHAAKFADYLISRGQRPVLDTIEPPRQQWTGVEQVIANVFRMEADVTSSVLQLYGTAEGDDDKRTTVFLDPIVDGQRISEHEAAYLLGRVKAPGWWRRLTYASYRRNRKRTIHAVPIRNNLSDPLSISKSSYGSGIIAIPQVDENLVVSPAGRMWVTRSALTHLISPESTSAI